MSLIARIGRGFSSRSMLAMVVLAPAALALAPGSAAAATINVTTTADNTDDDGLCSLREAVDAATGNAAVNVDDCPAGAAAPDTIVLPAGTYPLSGMSDEDANASGDLDVEATGGGPLRLEGAGQGSTLIDAAMNDRAIEHREADTLTLADLTVTNGKTSTGGAAAGRGGGIQTDGSGVQTLNLERVTVNGNESDYSGGGLFVGSGDVAAITDSTISGNESTGNFGGGGIGALGAVTLTGSTVTMNQAGTFSTAGGGGIATSSPLTLNDSAVTNNTAGDPSTPATTEGGDGGGIDFDSNLTVALTVTGSTIRDNATERSGGGIAINGAPPPMETVSADITDSLIADNDAVVLGGGISSIAHATLSVSSSAITGNEVATGLSSGGGGGIANGTIAGDTAAATVTDSVVSGNSVTGAAVNTDGGGLRNAESSSGASTLSVVGSTVSGNTVIGTVGDGAGIYNQAPGGQLTVLNSTLSGNMATGASGNGGGVFNVDGPVELIHTTVAANSAAADGDALANGNGATGVFELRSAVLAGSDAADVCEPDTALTDNGSNLDTGASCGLAAGSNLDPMLGPLADNGGPDAGPAGSTVPLRTQAIGPVGDAVDHVGAGDCKDAMGADLGEDERGTLRPQGPFCDAGSFEYADPDADGVEQGVDNCPGVANPGQEDNDADGLGNACDPTPDGTLAAAPSNAFEFGKLKRNARKGVAFLFVTVPGPGEIGLQGRGLARVRLGSAAARKSLAVGGGRVKLGIRPGKGRKAAKLRRRLRSRGKAKVKVWVTYVPTGGTARTRARKVKLVRR